MRRYRSKFNESQRRIDNYTFERIEEAVDIASNGLSDFDVLEARLNELESIVLNARGD